MRRKGISKVTLWLLILLALFFVIMIILNKFEYRSKPDSKASIDQIDNVDADGLAIDEALPIVKANCTACHSAKLITQNRATREGWKSMIEWMQKTQNLWPLGANEEVILNYLSKYYAPSFQGRRAPLTNIEWYKLEND